MFSPKNLILLLALLWGSFALQAQSCFIQEDDATGSLAFSTEQLAELEAAACSLRAVFPTAFQNDFAVYDFGFYLHQQGYEGGMPQVFQDKIAEVAQESPYFLLFGRELSNNSGLGRFWVEVRLPEGSGYPCLEDAYSSGLIYSQVSASIEIEGGYSSVGVSNMLLSGIETLNTLVDKSVNCCNVSDGNRSPLCTFCWFEESKYAEILSDYGYIEYKNVSIVIDSLDDPYEGMVNSDYEITISTPAGHTVNLIDDTQGFLESTALTTLGFGQVDVYRYSAGNCELLDNFLRGEVVNFGQSGAVYEEKIIILDFEGELRVFYKFSLDSAYGPGGSSLRQDLNSGQRVVFLPVIAHWVLKKAALAGTGVLAHVGTTLVFERWFGEYDNWGDAWDNCTFTAWELIYAGWETAFAETAFIQFFGDIGNSMVSYIMSSSSGTFTWDGFLGIGVVGGVKDALINLFAAGAVEGILSKAKKIFQKYHPNLQPSSGGGNSGGGGNNDNNWFSLVKELVDLLPTFINDFGTFPAWKKLFSKEAWRTNTTYLTKVSRYSDNGLDLVEEAGELVVKQADGVKVGKLDPYDPYYPGEMKVKGEVSGRHFDPDDAGGVIVKKSWSNPNINSSGVDDISTHLSRFDPGPEMTANNNFMLDRLNQIKNGQLQPTDFDKRFYTHELEEFSRYQNKGIPNSTNDPDFYYNAHTASLESYSLNEVVEKLYPPNVPYPGYVGY